MIDQLNTFIQLIWHDLLLFKRNFFNKIIDLCFTITTALVVLSYLLPFQTSTNYGSFILIGAIASVGYFEIIGRVNNLVGDIEGDHTISYFLTLPINTTLVFCYFAISWAIQSTILSLLVIPLGKIILFGQFNLEQISLIRFILIFVMSNLFFGFLSLLLASLLKHLYNISWIWVRILSPMYFFGCYLYPWSKAYSMSKIFGYISLLNPYVYIMEGMRAAMLGQLGYLSFWLCFSCLSIFTFLCAFFGIKIMKKRLDSV